MPVVNSMLNYVKYNDKILDLINSNSEFNDEKREKIKSWLKEIWPIINIIKTFNPEEIFNEYENILENVKTRQAILNIVNESSSVNDNIFKEVADTSTEDDKITLLLDIKDMIHFMNRIINTLEVKTLFFSEDTQQESFIFLEQLFNQLEKSFDIISSDLYNNKIIDHTIYKIIQEDLVDQAEQFVRNTEKIINTLDSEYNKALLNKLVIHTNKWQLYKAKYFFAMGQDEQVYEALEKINPKLEETYPQLVNFFKEKTDIITKIQSDEKRKTYVKIIEVLNGKDQAPSENKDEVKSETKNSLKNTLEKITPEKIESLLKRSSNKILNSNSSHEDFILKAVKSLHLVQTQEKVSLKDLEDCGKLYQELIKLTILRSEYTSLKKQNLVYDYKPIKDQIVKDLTLKYSLLKIRIECPDIINASILIEQLLSKEKQKKQEDNITKTIENTDKLKEEQAIKKARRLAKKAKRKIKKNEAPVDQQEKKPTEQLPSKIKDDSTEAFQAEKLLEKELKKQEELEKQKEQALLAKQKLEDEAKKQVEEERAKKKEKKKLEREKRKEDTQSQAIKLKQAQEEVAKFASALAITENPKKEEQPKLEGNNIQKSTSSSSLKEKSTEVITYSFAQEATKKTVILSSTQKTPVRTIASSYAQKAATKNVTVPSTEKAKSTSSIPATLPPTSQKIKKAEPITLKEEDFPPLSKDPIKAPIPVSKWRKFKPLGEVVIAPTKALTSEKPSEKELKEKQTQTSSNESLQEKIRRLEQENSDRKLKETNMANTINALRGAVAILDKNNNSNSDLLQYMKAALEQTHAAMLHNYQCTIEYANLVKHMQKVLKQIHNAIHNVQREDIVDTVNAILLQQAYIEHGADFNHDVPQQQYTPAYNTEVTYENKSENSSLASSSPAPTAKIKKKLKKKN